MLSAAAALDDGIFGNQVLITDHDDWPAARSNSAPPNGVVARSVPQRVHSPRMCLVRKGFAPAQPGFPCPGGISR